MFGSDQSPDTSKTRKKSRKERINAVSNDEKAARAHAMIVQRIDGSTYQQLAQQFNCSQSTAVNYVNYAREHGLYIDRARLLIEEQLLPRALAVFQMYMDGTRDPNAKAAHDLDAAKDVLFGLGVLSKTTTLNHQSSETDSLDTFRAAYFKAREQTVTVEALPPAHETIDDQPGRRSVVPDQSPEDR